MSQVGAAASLPGWQYKTIILKLRFVFYRLLFGLQLLKFWILSAPKVQWNLLTLDPFYCMCLLACWNIWNLQPRHSIQTERYIVCAFLCMVQLKHVFDRLCVQLLPFSWSGTLMDLFGTNTHTGFSWIGCCCHRWCNFGRGACTSLQSITLRLISRTFEKKHSLVRFGQVWANLILQICLVVVCPGRDWTI